MSIHTLISIIFGLCLILVLLIGLQWRHLRGLIHQRRVKSDKQMAETQEHLVQGLNTLLLCLIQEQVEVAEAVLRIKVHLDHLFPIEEQRIAWEVYYECARELEGFATHDARLGLKAQERMDQDRRRMDIEEKYLPRLMEVARAHYPVIIPR
jgi:hypothetical protein